MLGAPERPRPLKKERRDAWFATRYEPDRPFLVVDLDETCRAQQLGEGGVASLDEVPRRAISMSIRQIMRARTIICTVPEARKARPVRLAFEGPVTPELPASILQRHPDVRILLDTDSAAQLTR